MMKLVNIESPCKGFVPAWVPRPMRALYERCARMSNRLYAYRCVIDSLARGEAPYASHVFFDNAGLLNDADPKQRELGMKCGDAWAGCADLHAFYVDRGMSAGMQRRWLQCAREGLPVERRQLRRVPPPGLTV